MLTPYSIVVPARNEQETIGAVLQVVRTMTDDLIVVDGHSSDRTATIAADYGARVILDNGQGKGDAVRVGLAAAKRPITVLIDADGSHDPSDIPKLVDPIVAGQADLVIGSRMLGGSDELFASGSEIVRLMGSLVITLSLNYRFGVRLTDYQNGFRAIRTDVGRAIGLRSNITTIEQEMAAKCLKYGYRVIERPSHEHRRKGGISKINVLRVAHVYIWNLLCQLVSRSVTRGTALCPSCLIPSAIKRQNHPNLALYECPLCGLIYQNNFAEDEPPVLYGDSYYDHWNVREAVEDLWRMKLKTSNAYLNLLKPYLKRDLTSLELLDIGCAHGFMLEAGRQQGFNVTGVEISPAAETARARGFEVHSKPVDKIGLPSGNFDVVTMIDIIEHIPNVHDFARELHRIVKPDGLALIVTPNVGSWAAKFMNDRWPHYKKEHILYFNEHSLPVFLERAGFKVEHVSMGFKYLTFEYVLGHFQKYPRGWMTTTLSAVHRMLPKTLSKVPFRLPTELLILARRRDMLAFRSVENELKSSSL